MSDLLNSTAVAARKGADAQQILQAYIATEPSMVLNRTFDASPQKQPKGTGAGDQLIEPR